ncbi:acyl-CoA dehydrogenase family protein [Microvirga sp. CF3016]|uniref:acyl-CoA dehydrogenase family protein n=1 Tax=Microvirga sp. CF3016 TaxID=3110181 RepID=UPI002E7829AD|nr:acyl-CoA dehydrogenase [Microvirga sp. CF3016]MEE1609899.1 acyl-CoA dehydrogenase [Microvirga sp. CF3016]
MSGIQDFILDDEDRWFRAEVRAFLMRELEPRAFAIESDDSWDAVKAVVRSLGEAGYLALMFQDLYRGWLRNPGLTHATILSEEAAAINYAFETTIGTALSCAYPLHRYATPEIRERYLGEIINGKAVGAIGVTEPTAGSDTSRLQTRIVYDETSQEWVINGLKRYISNASVADVYIMYGVTDPDAAAGKGLSAVVVPAGTPGLSFPRRYTFMGRRGCVVGEVEMTNVRVPRDHLLGEPGQGTRIMVSMFNFERAILGGSGLGVARAAFKIAQDHAQTREAFGQKLGSKQLIWSTIAEMSWRIDAAELLTYRAAKLYDAGITGKDLAKPAAMAKLVSTETAVYCADKAVQILGGDGITKEYGRAEQLYRDARALPIVGGTSEMARYLIASSDLPTLKPNL